MSFIYIINPLLCNFIKIGKWSGSPAKLQNRYQTYYGKQTEIYIYHCGDYDTCEKDILKQCSNYAIDKRGELFTKHYISFYHKVCFNVCKSKGVLIPSRKVINNKCLTQFVATHLIKVRVSNMISDKTVYTKKDIENLSDEISKIHEYMTDHKITRSRIIKVNGNCLYLLKFNALLKFCDKNIKSDQKKKRLNGKVVDVSKFIITSN